MTNTQKWIKEVAPYVRARIEAGESESDATENGIRDYTNFLDECVEMKTPRMKKMGRLMCKVVFTQAHLDNLQTA